MFYSCLRCLFLGGIVVVIVVGVSGIIIFSGVSVVFIMLKVNFGFKVGVVKLNVNENFFGLSFVVLKVILEVVV